jgi:aspartyl protease family protein
VLVGHSDGASIALLHAGMFPGVARAVVAMAPHPAALRAAKAETQVANAPAQAASSSSAAIAKSTDGHFWARGTVNGASVRFLVDTGATAVALTPADAERLGLTPADLHYSYRVVTAGGQTRAASVKLASITVAGARLNDVDALVIEKGLDTSLLGMSYLGRLSRFEATRQSLVLTP